MPAQQPTAQQLIEQLKLQPHPEGGHYRETFRDSALDDAGRSRSSLIYFLLKAGEKSHWHRVDAVETWHWYAGAPLELSIWDEQSAAKEVKTVQLGNRLASGEEPQAVVPTHAWQSACCRDEFALVGCTVAPASSFETFELAPPNWSPPLG